MIPSPARYASLLAAALIAAPAVADEGMFTFDNPPTQQLKQKHGFEPTKEWLDHVRLASVRFMDGGSGSFVSPDGLMISNHHVGLGCIQNLSSAQQDYVKNGFYAETRAKEAACPGYEVNVLVGIEDASAKVLGAVTPRMSDKEAREARKAAITRIENDCNASSGLRCNVVTLYQGGEFQLYRYKKYTDVRLVFAPEQEIAFFGGDPDNFTFPRHDVDICLMRAYENGQPAKPQSYLPFSTSGVMAGDLVFVSGNPGSTSRLDTQAQLELTRDAELPLILELIKRRLDGAARVLRARPRAGAAGQGPDLRLREQPEGARRTAARAAWTRRRWRPRPRPRRSCGRVSRPTRRSTRRAADAWATIEAAREEGRLADPGGVPGRLLRLAAARHRGPDRALRRGGEEAQRAAARGVHRLEPRDPEEPALLTGPALRRPRGGDARQPARARGREAGARAPVREGRARGRLAGRGRQGRYRGHEAQGRGRAQSARRGGPRGRRGFDRLDDRAGAQDRPLRPRAA